MDNASKALVMAGAVLIAIMLITVGVGLLNAGSNSIDDSKELIETRILENYNTPFVMLAGPKVRGSDVHQLMIKIATHNGNTEEVHKFGKINYSGDSLDEISEVSKDKYYEVNVGFGSNGAVSSVHISGS